MMVWVVVALGCSDVCGTPDQLNGRAFEVFATPRTFDIGGDETEFPAETTPANGPVEIGFEWASPLPTSPLVITFDGQPSDEGTGQWSQVNCGNFTARWGGTYLAEDGAEHVYVAAGYFVQYDDQLEGFIDWSENWQAPSGRQGSYSSDVLLRGEEL